MSHVYIIMGNDFPKRVYANEALAQEFIEERTKENYQRRSDGLPIIHWRIWRFKLRTEGDLE